ncbi:MAG: PorV/PorQ family protein [Candidatus Eisenbacteria bacterium]
MTLRRAPWWSCLALVLLASRTEAAPAGFAFLEVPAGARASAMGGAYASVANGAEAAFWNPAGLAGVEGTQVTGTHYEFIENLRHDQFALAGHLFGGGIATSLRAMYSQPIEQRDDLGNLVGTFGAHDLEFLLGYGRKLPGGTSVGFSGQVIRERLANLAATTYALNGGVAWEPKRLAGARLSVSGHNLGPAAEYTIDGQKGRAVNLPTALQAGASYRHPVAGFAGLASLESRLTRGRQAVVAVGGELAFDVGAALRVGYRMGDDISSFSAGAGYAYKLYRVDYAFVPSKFDLTDTHRFSFSAQF